MVVTPLVSALYSENWVVEGTCIMMTARAEIVTNGHLVVYKLDNREVVGLKGVRHGKDHVNHYFVPLESVANEPLTVVYLDYSAELRDCHDYFSLELELLEVNTVIEVGAILSNATGTYLKAREPTKGVMSFVYVDLDSGELRRRQERQINALYRWTLTCSGIDPRQQTCITVSLQ